MASSHTISMKADRLTALVERLFAGAGLSQTAAKTVAAALVDAELEGQQSHGVMMADMYLERIKQGSVSVQEEASIIVDNGAILVMDAKNALGHLTGDQAMSLTIDRAEKYGLGLTAVRNGFHFGVARRFALAAADRGAIGIAMCNTRPLMPAPGGAERLVGNNPLAIALPSDGEIPVVLDMAMSEAAMGKIRMAAKSGDAIPDTWAAAADGSATTDPEEAIAGMLLAAAGPKGFGLAFIIDLLCGALSGGGWGDNIEPLFGDFAKPYNCAHLFIAIDTRHFGQLEAFRSTVAAAAERVRKSAKAPGVTATFAPGEPEWRRREQNAGQISLQPAIAQALLAQARDLQIPREGLDQVFQQLEEAANNEQA